MSNIITDENKIKQILERGVSEVIERSHLEERMNKGEQLRVKLGIDPTAKDLHLGHAVVLRKLRQFQDLGHVPVFIVGDFTATIGDPSGKSETRPELTDKQAQKNTENYLKEAGKILDIKNTEVRYNSEWYAKKGAAFLMELASKFTLARSLERDDFQKRLKENRDIGILEILYPIFQGYDSVEVKADVEIGGTDQKFNLLMGRKVQKRLGMKPQDILTTPLIEGLDGIKKMSKSLNNYIGLSDKSSDMFGKIMALPDDLMVKYFTLLTNVSDEDIDRLQKDRLNPGSATRSPKEWKEKLALEIVSTCYSEKEATKAKNNFESTFQKHEIPADMPEIMVSAGRTEIVDLLVKNKIISSNSEAKRIIEQGGVTLDGKVIAEWGTELEINDGAILRVGPRRFYRLRV